MCHGSDGRGAKGFPNLADDDWLYGGTPQNIEQSITYGRNGTMPPMGDAVGGEENVKAVAEYVALLNGRRHRAKLAEQGKAKFDIICSACHGMDGKGNQALGAPNLTNNVWLYGGTKQIIMETIRNGRSGRMPAHEKILSKDKIHLLVAYVYSLSHQKDLKN